MALHFFSTRTVDPRMSEISNLANDGTAVLSDFTYQYNAVGDITNWVQTQGTNPQQNASYAYDGSDRLTGVTLATPVTGIPTVTSYVYDKADNRLSEQRDNLVMQGSFNNLNQLTGLSGGGIIPIQGTVSKPSNVAVNGKASSLETNIAPYVFTYNLPVTPGTNSVSITALDGSGNASTNNYQIVVPSAATSSPTYDADGNCLSDGTRSYQWDALNRLIQITEGSNTYQFAYDGQSRRISETDNGNLTKQWVWVGDQMAEEQDARGTTTKRFYSQGEKQAGTPYYYASDHLGSVREMVDGSGAIQARYSYDSYGRQTKISGSLDSTFQYTGDYYHTASMLNLTKFRAYDSNTGRWLGRDPLKNAERRQGPNLYEYAFNDPALNFDPSGTCTCSEAILEKSLILDAASEWQALEAPTYWPNYLPGKTNDCGAQAEALLDYIDGLGLTTCWAGSLDYGERWRAWSIIGGSHNVIEFDPIGGMSPNESCCKGVYAFTLDPYAGNDLNTLLSGLKGPVEQSTPSQFFQNFPYKSSSGN